MARLAAILLILTLNHVELQAGEVRVDKDAQLQVEGGWHQWRGARRDGIIPGDELPANLRGVSEIWSQQLGKGYSGPIVSDKAVFVLETVDGAHEGAKALDLRTGQTLWELQWKGRGSVPFFAARSGDWIRSTPAFDGEALFVGGMEEVLRRIDVRSGEQTWEIDFPKLFGTGTPQFGFASSPLLAADGLYVQAANSIVKVDRNSGEVLWRGLTKTDNIFESGAFSSPILTEIGGREQLVVQTRLALHGLDPKSGELLWSQEVPNFRGMNILTPTVHRGGILTSTHRNRSYFFEITRTGDRFSSQEKWNTKVQGYMSSPVVIDGHAYLHLGNGRFACLELETGAIRWITKPFGKYWSLVASGGRILALDSDGELLLVEADPGHFELLDRITVSNQPTWAHLAVAGDLILVRELEGIKAFRWTPVDTVE